MLTYFKILTLVLMAVTLGDGVDLGRSLARHRRAITATGLTAAEELDFQEMQKTDFERFKAEVVDKIPCPSEPESCIMKKDIYLAKFFRVNKMFVNLASSALRDVLYWRHENNISTILTEDLSKGRELFEAHTDLQDVEGRPILYMQTGKWGLASAIYKHVDKLYERIFYALFEECVNKAVANFEAGKKNAQFTMLVNYDEWTTAEGGCLMCVTLVSRLGVNYESKWPRFGHKVILINVAVDFHLFFDLVRVALTQETNEKLAVFGRDRSQWLPEVSKLIDEKVIDEAIEKHKKH